VETWRLSLHTIRVRTSTLHSTCILGVQVQGTTATEGPKSLSVQVPGTVRCGTGNRRRATADTSISGYMRRLSVFRTAYLQSAHFMPFSVAEDDEGKGIRSSHHDFLSSCLTSFGHTSARVFIEHRLPISITRYSYVLLPFQYRIRRRPCSMGTIVS
jgi:hypothetical protein